MATEHDPNTTSAAPAASTSVTRRTSRRAVLAAGALASGAALGASLETSSIRSVGLNTALAGTLTPSGFPLPRACDIGIISATILNAGTNTPNTAVADQFIAGRFTMIRQAPALPADCDAGEKCVVTRVLVVLEIANSGGYNFGTCPSIEPALVSNTLTDETCDGSPCPDGELIAVTAFDCIPNGEFPTFANYSFRIAASTRPIVAGKSVNITIQIFYGPGPNYQAFTDQSTCTHVTIPAI